VKTGQGEQVARLEKPVRITEQAWPEGTVPLATIRCITYNHEHFIRDAVEGFLLQETDFPLEVLIHDDASADNTPAIVQEYQERYPHLIRSVLQHENLLSKGIRPAKYLQSMIRGEFVALCEGDDYWTHPRKLQKQISLLESNPEASGCFHAASVIDEKNTQLEVRPAHPVPSALQFEDVVSRNHLLTCSLVYRSSAASRNIDWSDKLPMADWPLQVELTRQGSLLGIDENMGCYRRHRGGIWTRKSRREELDAISAFYNAVEKRFDGELPDSFYRRLREHRKECLACSFGEHDYAGFLKGLVTGVSASLRRNLTGKRRH